MDSSNTTVPKPAHRGKSTSRAKTESPNDGIVNTMSMEGSQGCVYAAAGNFAAELDLVNPQTTMWGPFWHFGSNPAIDYADQLRVFTDASVVSYPSYPVLSLLSFLDLSPHPISLSSVHVEVNIKAERRDCSDV